MRFVERCFWYYGRFVARHPLPFLIVPLILSAISVIGVFYFHQKIDVWDLFAPDDLETRIETKTVEPFELITGNGYYRVQIYVQRRTNARMMAHFGKQRATSLFYQQFIREIIDFNADIEQNMTISWLDTDTNTLYSHSYLSVCGKFCTNDAQNNNFLKILQLYAENPSDPNFIMYFPQSTIFKKDIFLGYSLGGLTLNDRRILVDFNMIILHYAIKVDDAPAISDDFDAKIRDRVDRFNAESANLEMHIYTPKADLEAQNDVPTSVLPYLPLTVTILLAFSVSTLLRFPLTHSQHIEAMLNVVGPSLALVSTFGFLWMAGYAYTNILTVVPFLVLVIGMDDGFLLLAGWRDSDSNLAVPERIAQSMSHAGTSVTITSLTDVLCFIVGCYSSVPVVRLFSTYTAVALSFDYAYQLSLFIAVMTYCGRKQVNSSNSSSLRPVQNSSSAVRGRRDSTNFLTKFLKRQRVRPQLDKSLSEKALPVLTIHTPSSSEQSSESGDRCSDTEVRIVSFSLFNEFRTLIRYLLSPENRLIRMMFTTIVLLIYVSHLIASIYCASLGTAQFTLPQMFIATSRMAATTEKMERQTLNEAYTVNYMCPSYPNFGNATTKSRFLEMVHRLETIPNYGLGESSTRLWVRQHNAVVTFFGNETEAWTEYTVLTTKPQLFPHSWLRLSPSNDNETSANSTTADNELGNRRIEGFWWTTTYHNMTDMLDLRLLLDSRRAIAAEYPEFGVVGTHYLDKVADILHSCPSKLLQTSGAAVTLMAVLVFLFVRDISASFWVIQSLFSIGVGTIGYLQIWSVGLDSVPMIAILLAVGVTVDYTAHVCYHFFTHPHLRTLRKTRQLQLSEQTVLDLRVALVLDTYRSAGWPILQGILSNVAGMLPLILVNAYIVQVFWKTVILVAVLAVFHSHVFLPTAFITFTALQPHNARVRRKIQPNRTDVNNDDCDNDMDPDETRTDTSQSTTPSLTRTIYVGCTGNENENSNATISTIVTNNTDASSSTTDSDTDYSRTGVVTDNNVTIVRV